ncbi:cell wall metabolism sensor histidine kinase WalK [Nostoc sp. CHAB 5844]|nr:cell wall metabolism sensor histidine kinase WalK [Nostoc sp. CHAB 5844]
MSEKLLIKLSDRFIAIATLLGIQTSHWIIRPILALNQASQAIAEGNLAQKVATIAVAR